MFAAMLTTKTRQHCSWWPLVSQLCSIIVIYVHFSSSSGGLVVEIFLCTDH